MAFLRKDGRPSLAIVGARVAPVPAMRRGALARRGRGDGPTNGAGARAAAAERAPANRQTFAYWRAGGV
jgi:hypothetical protein